MTMQVRAMPEDLHKKFKLLCAMEDIAMNQKLIGMVREVVEDSAAENKLLAEAFGKALKKVGKK